MKSFHVFLWEATVRGSFCPKLCFLLNLDSDYLEERFYFDFHTAFLPLQTSCSNIYILGLGSGKTLKFGPKTLLILETKKTYWTKGPEHHSKCNKIQRLLCGLFLIITHQNSFNCASIMSR